VAERRGIWFTMRYDVSTEVDGYISLVQIEISLVKIELEVRVFFILN